MECVENITKKKFQNLKLHYNRFTQFLELIEWYLYVFQVILLLCSGIKKEFGLAFKMNAFAQTFTYWCLKRIIIYVFLIYCCHTNNFHHSQNTFTPTLQKKLYAYLYGIYNFLF